MNETNASRNKTGALTSLVGIVLNALLCSAKIAVGIIFNSVAVLGDGFNNLTDAGSSVVSMIGFRFSNKPADKDHPFGHARYEYITGLIIAFIVIFLGFEVGRDSIGKIIDPTESDTSIITIIVLAVSIAVKVGMFFYYRVMANRIDSTSLRAASVDSLNDSVATAVVLICALVSFFAGVDLDAYAGLGVALFILINGIKLVKETASPLLGEKPNIEFVKEIEKSVLSYDGVLGIHDLIVHNYGPGRNFVSVHVEVDASVDVMISHELTDKIERDMQKKNINLVVHMDPIINDERVNGMKDMVYACLKDIDPILRMHDFRVVWGEKRINLIFDIVVPHDYARTDGELVDNLALSVKEKDPRCELVVTVDKDYVGE